MSTENNDYYWIKGEEPPRQPKKGVSDHLVNIPSSNLQKTLNEYIQANYPERMENEFVRLN